MKNALMLKPQRSGGEAVWTLAPGASTTLVVHEHGRVLQAYEGRLWVTTSGTRDDAALDVWLMPGETLALAPGTDVVLEGWPSARFRVLVPAMAAETRRRWSDGILRAWARLRAATRPPVHARA